MDRVRQERSAFVGGRGRIDHGHLLPLRSFFAFVLIPLLAGLSVLAQAMPPDPLWIPGIYDAADDDDVAGAIVNSEVTGPSAGPAPEGSMRILIGSVTPGAEPTARSTAASVLRPRSPPFA